MAIYCFYGFWVLVSNELRLQISQLRVRREGRQERLSRKPQDDSLHARHSKQEAKGVYQILHTVAIKEKYIL